MTQPKPSRAEELAAEALGNAVWSVDGPNFRQRVIDAITKYGQEVRRRDAEVCLNRERRKWEILTGHADGKCEGFGPLDCAAAITKEPLP